MKYCPNCAYKLTGTEKFCPECSYKLVPREERAINIGNTSGDVIAAGASGSGNIIGKEVGYTIQGNVLNLQITGNVSTEVLDTLQRMMSISTRVEQACIITKDTFSTKETAHKQIKNVLEEVNKIEKKTGTEIEEIRAGDLQMSRNDLLLKEIILKGNEDFYKKEYKGAIKWYDRAIEIDAINFDKWFNKGYALHKLRKYEEAIECYDKALRINPNEALAWYTKGNTLSKLGKYEEAIRCYDKALKINPNYANAWTNKGYALNKLGNYQQALECYNEAIKLDPNNAEVWNDMSALLNCINKKKAGSGNNN